MAATNLLTRCCYQVAPPGPQPPLAGLTPPGPATKFTTGRPGWRAPLALGAHGRVEGIWRRIRPRYPIPPDGVGGTGHSAPGASSPRVAGTSLGALRYERARRPQDWPWKLITRLARRHAALARQALRTGSLDPGSLATPTPDGGGGGGGSSSSSSATCRLGALGAEFVVLIHVSQGGRPLLALGGLGATSTNGRAA